MLPILLIVFREIIEAAIVIGIVMAVTHALPGRNRLILAGVGGGVAGAVLLALGAGKIAEAMEGVGQEIFNGSVLMLAVIMIGWTVIWMKRHVKELTGHVRRIGEAVVEGTLPIYALSVVIATAVLREGAEIVLFTYGLLASGSVTFPDIMAGGVMGLAGGVLVGVLFYKGLLKISRKYIFGITSWLLILLAAGMAAQSVNFFVAAGFLPDLVAGVWDSSWLIDDSSLTGKTLHALIGYTASPSLTQLIAYSLTVFILGGLLYRSDNAGRQKPAAASH